MYLDINIKFSLTIISFFAAFVASSCSDKSGKQDDVVSVIANNAIKVPVDSILETLKVIPLEFNSDHYPQGVKSTILKDSITLIFDNKNIVYLYDSNGKYISDSSNKVGRGAGEYSIVTAMTYNKHNNCIEIATPANLLSYDHDFNLVKMRNLPTKKSEEGLDGTFFGYIYDISDHEHLLIPEGILDDNRKIIQYDSDSDKVINTVEYDKAVIADVTMQTDCFHMISDNELTFFPPGITDHIYSYNLQTGSFDKLYYIDFAPQDIDKSDLAKYSSDKEGLKQEILNSDKAVALRTMLCGNRLIIVYKDGKTLRDFHTLVWDLESNKGYTIDSYIDGNLSFPMVDYSDNGYLYSIVDKENLSQLTSGINPAKIEMPVNSIPDGSLVLLRYKLKRII